MQGAGGGLEPPPDPLPARSPVGGSRVALQAVTFHYPSRPSQAARPSRSVRVAAVFTPTNE